jgi:IS5 family transposase
MRQEHTVQATIFEVFARHEIGCALQAISQWLDEQRRLVSLVGRSAPPGGARDRTAGVAGGDGSALCAAKATAAAEL